MKKASSVSSCIVHALSSDDELRMQRLAVLRNDKNPSTSNIVDKKAGDLGIHQSGLAGEIAFACVYGLDVDETKRIGGDDGVDFRLRNGLTIDVKTRLANPSGSQFAVFGKDVSGLKADIGVLTIYNESNKSVTIVGWTTRVHAALTGKVIPFGDRNDRFTVTKLLDIERLGELIRTSNDNKTIS